MKDTIQDYDTSVIIGMIVAGVVLLAFFGKVDETTLMFMTNVVAYILGKQNAKS